MFSLKRPEDPVQKLNKNKGLINRKSYLNPNLICNLNYAYVEICQFYNEHVAVSQYTTALAGN